MKVGGYQISMRTEHGLCPCFIRVQSVAKKRPFVGFVQFVVPRPSQTLSKQFPSVPKHSQTPPNNPQTIPKPLLNFFCLKHMPFSAGIVRLDGFRKMSSSVLPRKNAKNAKDERKE